MYHVPEKASPFSQAGRFGMHQFQEHLEDTRLYCTWFSGGLRVIDIKDPEAPVETGFFIPEPIGGEKSPQTNDVDVDEQRPRLHHRPQPRLRHPGADGRLNALMGTAPRRLAAVEAFRHLSPAQHDELERSLKVVPVARGQALMRQGETADALYIVVSGRFSVRREGASAAIAEIGVGSPIGEIAFFAGGTRTASVIAERDSLALELQRADFDRLSERSPELWRSVMRALASRLAATTAGADRTRAATPRTIAVCRAGHDPLPPGFCAASQRRWACGHASCSTSASAREIDRQRRRHRQRRGDTRAQ